MMPLNHRENMAAVLGRPVKQAKSRRPSWRQGWGVPARAFAPDASVLKCTPSLPSATRSTASPTHVTPQASRW